MFQPLFIILICLVIAFIFSEVCKRMGLPRVIGQILSGLLLGVSIWKSYFFSQEAMDILSFLSNLGVVLLFYYVGLETNFKTFQKNLKRSIIIAIFNTTIPLIFGFVVMRFLFHFNNITSVIIGVALSVSAQSVSIDILEELNIIKSRLGNMIISAGAVDDIIELIMVTILLSSFHVIVSNLTTFRLMLDIIAFLVVIIGSRLWIIPPAIKFFGREKSSTSRFTGSMIIVLLIASLSEYLGVGLLIGAMIAGMIVRQTIFKDVTIPNWEEHDIAKSTHIIAFGFLIPLFFVWIGLNTDIHAIVSNIWTIIIFIAIAFFGTVGGTVIAVMVGKGKFSEGVLLGWGLNPKGDIELVIAALALKAAIISEDIFTSLVVMSLSTMVFSPIIFKRLVLKYNIKQSKQPAM